MTTETGAKRAYSLLALLTIINVLNFVDRQLLPSFANFIVPDLELTNTEFGLLTGLFFIIFYAAAGLFMGALADLTHRPRLIAAAVGAWSALTAASGAAVNFVTLAIPRALIGVGESALTPTAMSLLAERFSAARLGLAAGIYYLGVPVGAGISLLIAGYLGPAIGWRNCFYILGGIGLVFAVMMLSVRETRAPRPKTEKGPSIGVLAKLVFGALKRSPALCATMFGGVALHWAIGAAAFDQLWFAQERGFERAEIARLNGYAIVIGGIAGNLVGGFLGDWWQAKMKSGRPMLLFWLLVVTMPLNIAFRIVPPDSPFFWVGLYTGIFTLAAFYGPTFSTVQELAPPQARATVTAFFILLLNVVGLGLGITLTGVAIDQFAAAGDATPFTSAILLFTLFGVFAAPAFFLAGRWLNRDKARIAELGA